MLTIAASVLGGFVVGVALTAWLAFHVFGLLHEDAVRIVASHLAGIALPFGAPAVILHSPGHD